MGEQSSGILFLSFNYKALVSLLTMYTNTCGVCFVCFTTKLDCMEKAFIIGPFPETV